MEVARSWVMEHGGTYQAGTTTDERATPEKVVPLRPYTKVSNDYYDALIGVVSPSAYYVLHYLIRQTCGFHREATRSSLSVISEATNLSRHTVITALRELQDMHIVTSDGDTLTRTQIRTYQMQPAESWQLPAKTSAKIALVEKRKRTSAKIAHDEGKTSAGNALDDTPTSAKFAPIKRKPEKKEKREKETTSDADAPTRRTSSEPSSSKPRKERELSPDHQYRVDLIAAVSEARGCKPPNKDAEWAAAGKFFRWNDGQPAPLEDVVTCFTIEQRAPHWDTDTLTLNALIKPYAAYLRSGRAAFEKGVERKRAAAAGKYDAPRQQPQRSTSQQSTYTRSYEDALPK